MPIFISLFVYVNYGKVVSKDIRESQSYTLSQLKNSFDDNMETVINTSQLLAENDKINTLMTRKNFTKIDLLEAWKLKEDINTIKNSINFCSEIFVYFYPNDNIVSNTKLYSSKINYIFADTYQLTKEQLLDSIHTPDYQGYKIIQNDRGNKTILFLQNVYSYNYKDKLATIVTVVPWKNIALNIAPMEEGQVYWVNESNQILEGNDTLIAAKQLSYEEYSTENQLIFTSTEEGKHVNSFLQSKYYDFKYCITMPQDYYFREINNLRNVILIQLAVMVTLAIVLARYYSIKNYKPISKLIALLKKNKKAAKNLLNFENMEVYFENLYSENESLNNSWYQAKGAMVNQVISGFIKGWNYDESVLENMVSANSKITLNRSYIAMVITYMDITDCNLFLGINDSEKEKTFQLLKFVFKNIFDENILSKYSGFFSDIDGMHLCIINVNDDMLKNDILAYDIRKCLSVYKKLLNLKVNIGASKVHKGPNALPQAYNEANQVLSFQSFWGKDSESFAFYEETNMQYDLINHDDNLLNEKQKKLNNLVIAKEYEKVSELLNEMLDEMFVKDVQFMDMNRCRMFGLINTVYNCLSDIIRRNDPAFFRQLNPMQRMLKANSIESVRHILNDIIKDIMDHTKEHITNEHPKWIQEILVFIDENYDDPNLNVSILADKLNMNLSYVGRTFKNYTGYGITDLIHIRRVEECKKRLILGESVREVAESIGYLDSKSLIRTFKKYEGITPGQFKISCENEIIKLA
jgi:AraC-like DNA-binding protein